MAKMRGNVALIQFTLSHISQGWSHWYNTSQHHTDTTRTLRRHTHDDPLAPVAQG